MKDCAIDKLDRSFLRCPVHRKEVGARFFCRCHDTYALVYLGDELGTEEGSIFLYDPLLGLFTLLLWSLDALSMLKVLETESVLSTQRLLDELLKDVDTLVRSSPFQVPEHNFLVEIAGLIRVVGPPLD